VKEVKLLKRLIVAGPKYDIEVVGCSVTVRQDGEIVHRVTRWLMADCDDDGHTLAEEAIADMIAHIDEDGSQTSDEILHEDDDE
jgi:hypothetical protein